MGDDLLDRDQLLDAFKSVGVEHVDEALIDQIFCQLDLARTGYVTSDQLISIIKSIQESTSTQEEACSSPSSTTSYRMFPTFSPAHATHSSDFGSSSVHDSNNSLHSCLDIQLFSSLDAGSAGLVTTPTLLSYWESIGVDCGHQVLADLGLVDKSARIDLKELSNLLNDELNQSKDIISYPTINAAIATLQHEVRHAKASQDNMARERDKIRSDLQAATDCSAALAMEIDEQNSRQEKMMKNQIQMIKQDWLDDLKNVESVNEKEIEKKQSLILELERQLSKEKDKIITMEIKLKREIINLEKENCKLEQEYNAAQKKASDMGECNLNLQMELETTRQNDSDSHLGTNPRHAAPDVEELLRINKDLKDRNDELEFCFQTQSERGRARKRGRRNSSSSNSKERRQHLRSSHALPPNPMKRKGSPVKTEDDLDSPMESPRGEKLRKNYHLTAGRREEESKKGSYIRQESLRHELSLHSPEESPDRSRYSSTESLYQEGDKASLGSLETGGTKMEDLVKTVIFLKDKMKEFEKEMSGNSGSIKAANNDKSGTSNIKSEKCSPIVKKMSAVKPIMRSGPNLPANVTTSKNKNFNKSTLIESLCHSGEYQQKTIIPYLALDKCPMFSDSTSENTNIIHRSNSSQPVEVFKLEQHCRDLEKELDQVKLETVQIFSDITNYSEENSTLEVQNEVLQKKLERKNVLAIEMLRNIDDADSADNNNGHMISDLDKTGDSKSNMALNNQNEHQDSDEISQLKLKIKELEQSMLFVEEEYESDKKDLINKNMQLEQSLELMKEEFESMESYWQGKMDDERRFYEDQIRTGEEQFKELEDRLKEYIGLLEPENERMIDGVGALYTIDETCSMESQVTEWEEEISQLKSINDQLCAEHKEVTLQWSEKVKNLESENSLLSRKCSDLASLVRQELAQRTVAANSLLCWCSTRAASQSNLHTAPRLPQSRGPQSLPVGGGRLSQLRKYIQQDCRRLRGRREQLRREDDLDPEQSSRSLDAFVLGGVTTEDWSVQPLSM
eukprot:TRINITY_DN8028_c0_g1_i1.p1 TRINITY_DN8028_c0_g1~~TRINITY_DN8028_c0_g1_i1.p1  ORF type:complete len:1022 (-),score=304.52 TRINITY_DN8028_c0_g1_i1:104-3169(-)